MRLTVHQLLGGLPAAEYGTQTAERVGISMRRGRDRDQDIAGERAFRVDDAVVITNSDHITVTPSAEAIVRPAEVRFVQEFPDGFADAEGCAGYWQKSGDVQG